jgi:AcrR family transcriptional regulator
VARPRSDDKRSAILSAATRVIASHGLGAPTATIAKEAGVSNGSLFTYFATKTELFNHLYLELKGEMATVALGDVPVVGEVRQPMFALWNQWLHWASASPEKRRALAHLAVSADITPASREAGHEAMAGIAKLLDRSRDQGPMRDAPLGFVLALMNALADTTVDFMIQDPAHAEDHCKASFDALWRMLS